MESIRKAMPEPGALMKACRFSEPHHGSLPLEVGIKYDFDHRQYATDLQGIENFPQGHLGIRNFPSTVTSHALSN